MNPFRQKSAMRRNPRKRSVLKVLEHFSEAPAQADLKLKRVHRGARLLLIDQYDSFIYNLDHALQMCGAHTRVVRPEAFSPELLQNIDALVLSPGPGAPEEALAAREALARLPEHIPVLGVCLGHQVLAHMAGARVERAPRPMHGRTGELTHEGSGLFAGLPERFRVGRYHSLAVCEASLPPEWIVTARSSEPEDAAAVMALQHVRLPRYGVQFHPESILTEHGAAVIRNFIELL